MTARAVGVADEALAVVCAASACAKAASSRSWVHHAASLRRPERAALGCNSDPSTQTAFYVGIAPALTTAPRLHSQSGHRRARAVKEVANKKVQRQRWMKLHRPMAFARIQREVQRKRRLALRVGSAFFSVPADCFEFMVQCSCSGTSSISRSLHTEAHVYAQSWGSAC